MKNAERNRLNAIGTSIVRSAVKVHKSLGPGLLESAYQACHVFELRREGLRVETEVTLPIKYGRQRIDNGFRLDVIVERSVVIENKAVGHLLPIHSAQLITYLKLSDLRLGYLLNWNVKLMRKGVFRFVNEL